jgi:hypothetical protein
VTNSEKATTGTCLLALAIFLSLSSIYIFYFKEKAFLDFVGYFALCSGIFAMLAGSLVKGVGERLYPDRGVQREVYGEVKNDFSSVLDDFKWIDASADEKAFLVYFILMLLGFGAMVGAAISFSIIRFF